MTTAEFIQVLYDDPLTTNVARIMNEALNRLATEVRNNLLERKLSEKMVGLILFSFVSERMKGGNTLPPRQFINTLEDRICQNPNTIVMQVYRLAEKAGIRRENVKHFHHTIIPVQSARVALSVATANTPIDPQTAN